MSDIYRGFTQAVLLGFLSYFLLKTLTLSEVKRLGAYALE